MTTDLAPKKAASAFEINGNWVRIGGIAKGSGMIAPNMATMLGFITTDASISPALLQSALAPAADRSFNCMTVDGDTSTNDSLIIMANGRAMRRSNPTRQHMKSSTTPSKRFAYHLQNRLRAMVRALQSLSRYW